MPDPLTSEMMHELGQDHAAKWLFAQLVQVCRAMRRRKGQPRLITRSKVEELCRGHHVPVEAINALVAVVDQEGTHLFLAPWPEEMDTFRLPDYWCDSSAQRRTERYRLRAVDSEQRTSREVADAALRDLDRVAVMAQLSNGHKVEDDEAPAAEALPLFPDGEAPVVRWVRGEPPAEVVREIYDLWWATYKGQNPNARYRNLTVDRRKVIVTTLKKLAAGLGQEGRDAAIQVCQDGVRGWVHDTFGDRGRFSDLRWVLRSGNVEQFADWFHGVNLPRATVNVPRVTAGAEAVASAARKRELADTIRRQRAEGG